MAKQFLDTLVDNNLGGDKSRASDLFRDDSIFTNLIANTTPNDWFHFEEKTLDGDYFIRSGSGYVVYYQERGRESCTERFNDINKAAIHFFKSTGYSK